MRAALVLITMGHADEEVAMSLKVRTSARAGDSAQEPVPDPTPAGAQADCDGAAEVDELLGRFRATAAKLLYEHVNAIGHCANCHRAWPCDIACQAEFTLGAF
jgi:hypothetical protein